MKSKKALKGHTEYNGSFFTEDLTQFRSKLLWYAKKQCDGRFVKCHTKNGDIYAKLKEAQEEDDDWVVIKTPEDFFKFDIEVDFSKLNDTYLKFSVLEHVDPLPIFNRFEELIDATVIKT